MTSAKPAIVSSFGLNKSGDIRCCHFLRIGAVSQEKSLTAAVGTVGTFRDMDNQHIVFAQFFDVDGYRRIAGTGHVFDLRKRLVGEIAADNPVVVIDPDKNASAGTIRQGRPVP
jgi:hypothetical protein